MKFPKNNRYTIQMQLKTRHKPTEKEKTTNSKNKKKPDNLEIKPLYAYQYTEKDKADN